MQSPVRTGTYLKIAVKVVGWLLLIGAVTYVIGFLLLWLIYSRP